MPERIREDSTSPSKLDELLGEYAGKIKLRENEVDIDSIERYGSESEITDQNHCEFEDTCYAFKFDKRTCPCELIR